MSSCATSRCASATPPASAAPTIRNDLPRSRGWESAPSFNFPHFRDRGLRKQSPQGALQGHRYNDSSRSSYLASFTPIPKLATTSEL